MVTNSSDDPYVDPACVEARWRVVHAGASALWDWSGGEPPVRELEPVRRLSKGRSQARSIPGRAFSLTTCNWVGYESGLEHDLIRWLDRAPGVVWLLSQPVRLEGAVTHVPDLLEVQANGHVRLWDVRPRARMDARFEASSTLAREACAAVGWGYQVFSGHDEVTELNLHWIHGHRRQPYGFDVVAPFVLADCAVPTELAVLLDDARACPEYIAALWHLVWAREIQFDLAQPITAQTSFTALSLVHE